MSGQWDLGNYIVKFTTQAQNTLGILKPVSTDNVVLLAVEN